MTDQPLFPQVPSPEENPHGFHARYKITKADGSPVDPRALYFVLRLDPHGSDMVHLAACRAAAKTYCAAVGDHPVLSQVGRELKAAIRYAGDLFMYREPRRPTSGGFDDYGKYAEFTTSLLQGDVAGWVGGLLYGYNPAAECSWISSDGRTYRRCRIPVPEVTQGDQPEEAADE